MNSFKFTADLTSNSITHNTERPARVFQDEGNKHQFHIIFSIQDGEDHTDLFTSLSNLHQDTVADYINSTIHSNSDKAEKASLFNDYFFTVTLATEADMAGVALSLIVDFTSKN